MLWLADTYELMCVSIVELYMVGKVQDICEALLRIFDRGIWSGTRIVTRTWLDIIISTSRLCENLKQASLTRKHLLLNVYEGPPRG